MTILSSHSHYWRLTTQPDALSLKIVDGGLKPCGVVFEMAKTPVAMTAQKPANAPRDVTVVDVGLAGAAEGVRTTRTTMLLRGQHLIVAFYGKSISPAESISKNFLWVLALPLPDMRPVTFGVSTKPSGGSNLLAFLALAFVAPRPIGAAMKFGSGLKRLAFGAIEFGGLQHLAARVFDPIFKRNDHATKFSGRGSEWQ
jgi:hypothetical protein